jgi:hypothetical protein
MPVLLVPLERAINQSPVILSVTRVRQNSLAYTSTRLLAVKVWKTIFLYY